MKSILIIDDEQVLLDMFEKILSRFGYNVDIARNGDEAISLFESKDFDLVITDVVMPEMDGNFIANYIRNSDKDNVPVIGMTGTPAYADKEGFDVVLYKPFSVDVLVENVQTYLKTERSFETGT